MEFLKRHYEKLVLCVVLLGLAGAVLWMNAATQKAHTEVEEIPHGPPPKPAPVEPLDLSVYEKALAQITNAPQVVLSGEHNLFNPVTWKRKSNGDLLKVIKTGADALVVTNITPFYTVITFENTIDGPIYVFNIQREVTDLQHPSSKIKKEFLKIGETKKSSPVIVRGIKGADTDPSEINLEITETGETNVWVSTNHPYQHVESYHADLRYDPELLTLHDRKVNDTIKLDNDPYIIVAITNNAVSVKSIRTYKVTELKWTKSP